MPRQRARGRDVSGILLLDKPRGLTSNQALQRAKRLYRAAKAGHTGSLDPLATGMLPICFGHATRLSAFMLEARKAYGVTARLGIATDTGDADGEVVARADGLVPDATAVAAALRRFVGEIAQVPPMYSALKREGVPLYRLARRGISVPREARRVTVDAIELEEYRWPNLRFSVHCSKGTYVRTLVADIAAELATIGHVLELRRLAVEPFAGRPMATLEDLERLERDGGLAALDRQLLPLDSPLEGWARVLVGEDAVERLAHGQALPAASDWPAGRVAIYAAPDTLLAIGEVTSDRRLVPRRVFVPQVLGAAAEVSVECSASRSKG